MRFAPDVHVLDLSPPVLFHARTGRHFTLSHDNLAEVERWTPGLLPPPDLAGLARRLDALHLLRESAPPDLARLVPCRSRLALLFPDEPSLWLPVPALHPAGGHPWRALPLTAVQLALWRACNGSRTVTQVADLVRVPVAEALPFFATLTHPAAQALQLRASPLTRRDPSLERLVCPARLPNVRPADQHGDHGETTLASYHLAIADGAAHFDDHETTIAHSFGAPHPALAGQRYGERLHDRLGAPDDGLTVEIGPGSGELGAAWLSRVGRPVDYLRIDQSPELLRTQRTRMPGTRELLGSATSLPIPDRSAGLVICNEVLADLSAAPAHHPDVASRLRRYRLASAEGQTLYNLGAWQLVEELARVLAPGGVAFLSEFGGMDELPTETAQLDHPEVSIHFGQLVVIARALGMQAHCEPLADWIGFELGARQLARHSYEGVRARMRAESRPLAARAWTPETLVLPWTVEGLQWVPLSENGPGPLVTRFMALVLRR